MNASEIKEFYNAHPFQPFDLVLTNGSAVKITHPEFVSFSQDYRTLHVWEPSGHQKLVDIKLIIAVNRAPLPRKKARRADG